MLKSITNLSLVCLLSGCAGISLVDDRENSNLLNSKDDYVFNSEFPTSFSQPNPIDMTRYCDDEDVQSFEIKNAGLLGNFIVFITGNIVHHEKINIKCVTSALDDSNNPPETDKK